MNSEVPRWKRRKDDKVKRFFAQLLLIAAAQACSFRIFGSSLSFPAVATGGGTDLASENRPRQTGYLFAHGKSKDAFLPSSLPPQLDC